MVRLLTEERKVNYLYMLTAMVLIHVAIPFLKELGQVGGALLNILISMAMVLAAYTARPYPRLFWMANIFLIPALVFNALDMVEGVRHLPGMIVYAVSFWAIVRHMIEENTVSLQTIASAITGYMIMGVIWAYIYLEVESVVSGSFHMGAHQLADQFIHSHVYTSHHHFYVFYYFSFVTLTTLGYGDMAPATEFAMSLCTLESIVGQIYLTVVVAHFVGMRVAQASEYKKQEESKPESGAGRKEDTFPDQDDV